MNGNSSGILGHVTEVVDMKEYIRTIARLEGEIQALKSQMDIIYQTIYIEKPREKSVTQLAYEIARIMKKGGNE